MKLFILMGLIFCSGCSTTIESPWTHIEYTGKVNEEGVSLNFKPPFWQWCVNAYEVYISAD